MSKLITSVVKLILHFISSMSLIYLYCGIAQAGSEHIKEGYWRLKVQLSQDYAYAWIKIENLSQDKKDPNFFLLRGQEQLKLPVLAKRKGEKGLRLGLHIYDADLLFNHFEVDKFKGSWIRKDKNPEAHYDIILEYVGNLKGNLFPVTIKNTKHNISGKWKWIFNPNTKDQEEVLGVYEQKGFEVKGTIATPTGDYGLQEGIISDNELILSTFDGVFAYLIRAKVENNRLEGQMHTAKDVKKFIAIKDDQFQLPDPHSLTKLVENKKIVFNFPSAIGQKMISSTSSRYKDKPLIIQIYGSWCPNCRDETIFLADWYLQQKGNKKVEIVAIAFERSKSMEHAKMNVKKSITQLSVPYEFAIASFDSSKKPNEIFPLDNFMSYPTTLFLDKNHKVVKIHTGFAGPSAGEEYRKFVQSFEKIIMEL